MVWSVALAPTPTLSMLVPSVQNIRYPITVAPEAGAVQETLILVGLTRTALRLIGGLASEISRRHDHINFDCVKFFPAYNKHTLVLPTTVRLLVSEDLLLDTAHVYTPTSFIATLSVFS